MASPGSLQKDTLNSKHTSLGWRTDDSDACTSLLIETRKSNHILEQKHVEYGKMYDIIKLII